MERERHSSQNSRRGEMKLRCWLPPFLLLTSTNALPSAEPDAEPHLYGSDFNPSTEDILGPMLSSGGPGGQGFNPGGGLQPGEGGQGHYPGGAGGAAVVQPSPGGVWGGGVSQGDQCGMMDQCCGE